MELVQQDREEGEADMSRWLLGRHLDLFQGTHAVSSVEKGAAGP
jgi:hypothetical protein